MLNQMAFVFQIPIILTINRPEAYEKAHREEFCILQRDYQFIPGPCHEAEQADIWVSIWHIFHNDGTIKGHDMLYHFVLGDFDCKPLDWHYQPNTSLFADKQSNGPFCMCYIFIGDPGKGWLILVLSLRSQSKERKNSNICILGDIASLKLAYLQTLAPLQSASIQPYLRDWSTSNVITFTIRNCERAGKQMICTYLQCNLPPNVATKGHKFHKKFALAPPSKITAYQLITLRNIQFLYLAFSCIGVTVATCVALLSSHTRRLKKYWISLKSDLCSTLSP